MRSKYAKSHGRWRDKRRTIVQEYFINSHSHSHGSSAKGKNLILRAVGIGVILLRLENTDYDKSQHCGKMARPTWEGIFYI